MAKIKKPYQLIDSSTIDNQFLNPSVSKDLFTNKQIIGEKPSYQDWINIIPNDRRSDVHYDMKAAYENLPLKTLEDFAYGKSHLPDTYKKTSHPTFSVESIYNNSKTPGGVWSEKDGKSVFTPSQFNIDSLGGVDKYKEWFSANEKDAILNLPTSNNKQKSMSPTLIGNITNGINAATSLISGLMSINSVNKSKPRLLSQPAKTEPFLIEDNTAQQAAAGQESIDKSIRTTRDTMRRSGLLDSGAITLSKELEANNKLSAQLESSRMAIQVSNVASKNAAQQENIQRKMNVDNTNVQIINNDEQIKTQERSAIFNNMAGNIQQNLSGIAQNVINKNIRLDEERRIDENNILNAQKQLSAYQSASDIASMGTVKNTIDMLLKRYKTKYGTDYTL